MNKKNALIVILILIFIGIIITHLLGGLGFAIFINTLIILELISYLLIKRLRKESPLFITSQDETPKLNEKGLTKFFKHGYDPELGWIRKPNTEKEEQGKFGKTKFHINQKGARNNPGHENLSTKISCYGDSFTFSRQVNDHETWEWFLSELTKSNVTNFGVGNYGADQSLLRLKREFPKNKSKIVLLGVVPSTIVRILALWKHYHDYGNTFGFKPKYILRNKELKLIPNLIDKKEKFYFYQKYIKHFRKHDYFYKNKFKKEILEFPYSLSIISNPLRNLPLITLFSLSLLHKKRKTQITSCIYPKNRLNQKNKPTSFINFLMTIRLMLFTPTKYNLFKKNKCAVSLLIKIIEEFKQYGEEEKITPIFVWLPQKDDILFIKNRKNYYKKFIENINRTIKTIDLTPFLLKSNNLNDLYSDDNTDGGHFSAQGNKKIAEVINNRLKEWKLI